MVDRGEHYSEENGRALDLCLS